MGDGYSGKPSWTSPLFGSLLVSTACMYRQHFQQSMGQPGKVTNPALGKLNRGNEHFAAPETFASRDGFGRLVPRKPVYSTHSSWIWFLLTVFLPLSATASIYYTVNRQPPSGQSRVYRVAQLPTNDVHYRESAGTGQVALKVISVTGAAFSGIIMDPLFGASLFPPPLLIQCSNHVR